MDAPQVSGAPGAGACGLVRCAIQAGRRLAASHVTIPPGIAYHVAVCDS